MGWSEKYKKSIDCNNPKGFSQKAHCAGKKKNEDMVFEEITEDILNEKLITYGNRKPYGQVVFMAGGAGSGKGFAIKNFVDSASFKIRDVDEMKKQLQILNRLGKLDIRSILKKYGRNIKLKDLDLIRKIEKDGYRLQNLNLKNPDHVYALHTLVKAMGIKDASLANLLKGKDNPEVLPNILFDITAKDVTDITSVIPKLKEVGYKPENIHLTWILTSYVTAMANNKNRSRMVPEDILLKTHEGAANTVWGLVTKALPKGMNGRVDVILNNPEHTVFYTDADGKTISGNVKGFLSLPLKKEKGGIFPEKVWKVKLFDWVKDNAPDSITGNMQESVNERADYKYLTQVILDAKPKYNVYYNSSHNVVNIGGVGYDKGELVRQFNQKPGSSSNIKNNFFHANKDPQKTKKEIEKLSNGKIKVTFGKGYGNEPIVYYSLKESVNEAKSITLITFGGRKTKYSNSDIDGFISNLDLTSEDLPGLIYKASMGNSNIIGTNAKSYNKKKEAILKLLKKIKSHNGNVVIDVDSKNPSFKHAIKFESVGIDESTLSQIHKAAKKGSYPVTIVATMLGKVVKQELVKTPMAVPAAFRMMQGAYPKAKISVESRTGQILFQESVINEFLRPSDVDSTMKEFGIKKIPISSQGERILKGMQKEGFINKVTNKERLIYFYESLGKEKFGYGVKGKPLSPLVDRYSNDISSEAIFFGGKMAAWNVVTNIKDRLANREEVDSTYYMLKDYFNSFGMDTNRSRIFKSAMFQVDEWLKRNKKIAQQIGENNMKEFNEAYKGNMSDFKYEFPNTFEDETGNSTKAIKKVSKKGKGYEVRTSTYMSEPEMKKVGDALGLKLVNYQKSGNVAITLYESISERINPKFYDARVQYIDPKSKKKFVGDVVRYDNGEYKVNLGKDGRFEKYILAKEKDLKIVSKSTKRTFESVNEGKFKPSQVRSAISKVKKGLMRKWKQKGGYENFGQKELSQMKDKFDYNAYGDKDEREISHMLDAFDNWAMNYDGNMREALEERVNLFFEENCPTDASKWSYYKGQAKKKFDVYPSAYANGWAAKQYKAAGGGWKKCK
jgi:hypothetical protein